MDDAGAARLCSRGARPRQPSLATRHLPTSPGSKAVLLACIKWRHLAAGQQTRRHVAEAVRGGVLRIFRHAWRAMGDEGSGGTECRSRQDAAVVQHSSSRDAEGVPHEDARAHRAQRILSVSGMLRCPALRHPQAEGRACKQIMTHSDWDRARGCFELLPRPCDRPACTVTHLHSRAALSARLLT